MAEEITLQSKITAVPHIGPAQAAKLERLGITTIRELIYHFPVKYRDSSQILPLSQLALDRAGTVQVLVNEIKMNFTRSGMVITKATVSDSTGKATVVWFNQKYIVNTIRKGKEYLMSLKLPDKPSAKDYYCNEYQEVSQELKHLGKIVPYYNQTAGVTSRWIRTRMADIKDQIDAMVVETLPSETLHQEELIGLSEAIYKIHFPESSSDIDEARKRLGFDEMLSIAIKLEKRKKATRGGQAQPIEIKGRALRELVNGLPYSLTSDQEEAIEAILADMQETTPMYRLLNGDVGSGKTVVAAIASYMCVLNNLTSIIMAPTTILANQHYQSLVNLFDTDQFKIQLLLSGQTLEPTVKPQIIVGTHAILHEQHIPENIGLVIVDEQHRFGVKQREGLRISDRRYMPHYLTMTATPIPRTLATVIYGDMEVSQIREMPKDRIPVESHVVPPDRADDCYAWIKNKIIDSDRNEQAFIIFPLIEESEKSDLKAATTAHKELSSTQFKELNVGLLHGRLKNDEKGKVLQDFKEKKYNILISTTVVEVGIDIPDATIVVIEHAERFGLAQLHQLRGRVGRGDLQSFCYLIPSKEVEDDSNTDTRLKYFASHSSGFDVAEYDLRSRGPGEVYGLRQSGLPELKIASLTDTDLLLKARAVAKKLTSKSR